ncbi:MAG: hypothetical protein KDI98_08755 [Hyphomicrobiaceae bacterium]|nr:hypothetical protein [Hyphomicrobiaceae bacterium]
MKEADLNSALSRSDLALLAVLATGGILQAGVTSGMTAYRLKVAGRRGRPSAVESGDVVRLSRLGVLETREGRTVLSSTGRALMDRLLETGRGRQERPQGEGTRFSLERNLPLAAHERLAAARFLGAAERAALRPRIGPDWDGLATGKIDGGKRRGHEPLGGASEEFLRTSAALGSSLSSLLVDALVFDLGLGDIERRRNWPARSARVALRLALEALCRHYGYEEASGGASEPAIRPLPLRPQRCESGPASR